MILEERHIVDHLRASKDGDESPCDERKTIPHQSSAFEDALESDRRSETVNGGAAYKAAEATGALRARRGSSRRGYDGVEAGVDNESVRLEPIGLDLLEFCPSTLA